VCGGLKAAADAPAQPELILPLGPLLHADVEGLAIYRRGAQRLLVVSSQGNDSYALFDAEPPHAPRGAFRIGLNAALGIDGASETDGLDVTPINLGAPYEEGLLVVQDGRKNLPLGPQNFKLLPASGAARGVGWRETLRAAAVEVVVVAAAAAAASAAAAAQAGAVPRR
jgi:3-phytase